MTRRIVFMLAMAAVSALFVADGQAGVRPGDFAIDFTAMTADGTNIHLWDYLGDVILLDFSTLW